MKIILLQSTIFETMELSVLLSFASASTLLALMPGPDNIYVLTESLSKGKNTGILIATGLCLGVIVHTTAVVTGVALFLQNSPTAFNIVKYAGTIYLLYLAYQSYFEKPITIGDTQSMEARPQAGAILRKGFLMNVLNPKVTLFFIAFLPQFVAEGALSSGVQLAILGLVFMLTSFVVFSLIAILANQFTRYLNSARFWEITKWVKIMVLVGLAVWVVL